MVEDESKLFVNRERGGARYWEKSGFTGQAVASVVNLVDKGSMVCMAPDPYRFQWCMGWAFRDGREEPVPEASGGSAAALASSPGGLPRAQYH